jgi:3-oxoacyl-[acyl-carrier protein] reductase
MVKWRYTPGCYLSAMQNRSDSPVALVTGATRGIGRAIAFALGRAGWRVGVNGLTPTGVADLVDALRGEGVVAAGAAGNVGDERDVARVVATIEAELGPVDTLVNNAGILINHRIEALSVADWDTTLATNLRSIFLTTRLVLPGMRARRTGDIVNIASLAGRNGLIGGTAYGASKHAVLGFSKSLMLETRKDGIRVIAICPGSVNTELLVDQPHLHSNLAKALAPEDVADTVLQALRLPRRALLSEIDIRPSDP